MIRVNKIAKEGYNLLNNSKKDFEAIFNIMFMHENNTLAEKNDGSRIYKTTYKEAKEIILDKAYSINMKYPDLKDEYIGISYDSSLEWIIIFWAILASGNKPYLINHRHPKNLTNNILDTLNSRCLIGVNMGYSKPLINYYDLDLKNKDDYKFNFANEIALSTSATTLKEKIIFFNGYELSTQILNSRSILKENKQIKKHYHDELKQLVFLPLYHIFGLVAVYLWFSFFGRCFVFLNNYSADTILNTIRLHNVTHVFAVPLFWSKIEAEINNNLKQQDEKTQKKFEKGIKLSIAIQKVFPHLGLKIAKKLLHEVDDKLFGKSVKFAISGGGYIKDETLRLINALGYPLHDGYGMSEVGITSVELSKNITDRMKNSIGKPFKSVEYKLENNELLIKGKSISHKFLINKQEYILNEDEYFKTNDIVHKDAKGRYYVEGRFDDLFISSNGENVSPDTIEKEINLKNVLAYVVTKLDDDLVLIVGISPYLTENKVIELKKNIEEELDKIDSSLRPNKYYFTYDPLMSKEAIKVSRQYVKRNLDNNEIHLLKYDDIVIKSNEFENNKLLQKIIEIFEKELGKKVNPDDNIFYDLSATSLDYFSILSKVNEEFEVNLSYELILPTPVLVAKKIEEIKY